MDVDTLAERILLDLSTAFKKDPLIDEFDILPVTDDIQNKCPVIQVNHKLALEGWCVKHVYLYSYSQLMKWREQQYRIDPMTLLSWTRAVLLINPDAQTAWNIRKELIVSEVHEVENELRFSELVLSRKPKCPDLFAHRKWLLHRLMKNSSPEQLPTKIVESEFHVCTKAADSYPNNYYAWSHRIWVVQELANNALKVILQELERTQDWVSNHVSDYSGFHYRQFLITFGTQAHLNHSGCSAADYSLHKHILGTAKVDSEHSSSVIANSITDIFSFLHKELLFTSELILAFPGHEALWCHRRFAIYAICHTSFPKPHLLVPNCSAHMEGGSCNRVKKSKLESSCGTSILSEEEKFVKECLQHTCSNHWQQHLLKRHVHWLQKVLLWPISLPLHLLEQFNCKLNC